MDKQLFSRAMDLKKVKVTDSFWKNEIELVRTEVIPYQWNALNDNVEGAAPSFCMRNFKVAGRLNQKKRDLGNKFVPPTYTFRGFEALPEDPENPDPDQFYGFVFQDTDFSKWIEAVAYSLTQHPDEELEKIADEAIDIVVAAQQEDGYLDTYYIINGRDQSFTNLRDHHELYCFGHLTEGAVAYYQATGKDKLLKAAERFADYLATVFGEEEGKCKGYPGHEIAEMALIRLYEVTGNEAYFRLGKFFIDERGKRPYYFDSENHPEVKIRGHEQEERYHYNQAHKPVREQTEATGHAVRAVYLYSGMADVARISGDDKLFEACEKLWNNMVEQKMYITGGIGATHLGEAFSFDYDLPNDTAYAETCASIGILFWARRMLEIKPDSKYADVMERALYNGVLSGMALDGKSFFYVNPLEVNPKACHRDERKFHVKPIRQKWFGCACCPPNLARLISSIGTYAYTESEDTLFVHLYIGAEMEKTVGDRQLHISMQSGFPWNGDVRVKVTGNGEKMKLALRIPDWCQGNYHIEGVAEQDCSMVDGYLYIEDTWQGEKEITLHFPMDVVFYQAREEVREDYGKVAVARGPIIYCLEEADNGEKLYELFVDASSEAVVEQGDICGVSCNKVKVPAKRIVTAKGSDSGSTGLYHRAAKKQSKDVELTMIPYFMWANRGENEMTVWVNEQ